MRHINWQNFKPSPICHFDDWVGSRQWPRRPFDGIEIVSYDRNARISPLPPASPACSGDNVAFLADPKYMHLRSATISSFVFTYEHYCWVIFKRLSSLPEHRHMFRHHLWLTEADRDFIFNYAVYGSGYTPS